MADNEDTDMPEDGAPGPDPTVDETGGPDAGGPDMEDIGDGGTEVASVDNSDELLAQEDPPEITRTLARHRCRSASFSSWAAARSLSWTERSAKQSTYTSTTASSRAAKSSLSKNALASR